MVPARMQDGLARGGSVWLEIVVDISDALRGPRHTIVLAMHEQVNDNLATARRQRMNPRPIPQPVRYLMDQLPAIVDEKRQGSEIPARSFASTDNHRRILKTVTVEVAVHRVTPVIQLVRPEAAIVRLLAP